MRFHSLVSVAVGLTVFSNAGPVFAQDDCASPTAIAGVGVFPFDNSSASTGTHGQMNPFCAYVGSDLWFRWTAQSSGLTTFFTCGQSAHDTNIAVYSGAVCPTAAAIVCDDDACGLESFVSFTATSGTTYMLQVGSSGGGPGGPGTFTINVSGPPAEDDCSTPLSITGMSGASYDNTVATTGAQGQGHLGCTDVHYDLWYEWVAQQNGTATLDTCFQSAMDTVVAVYSGAGCPAGAPLACDDNTCGFQSQMTWPIVAGITYTIEIGNAPFVPGGPGSFVLTVQGGGSSGVPYCSGDGTGTLCPCGNNGFTGNGCGHSADPLGANLTAIGAASVSNDTLVLQGSSMPATATALYFQGTQRTNGGLGSILGDGLRCVSGTVIRLATKTNSGGASSYGGPAGDIPISIRGQIPLTGGTRQYQVWFRNSATFCTAATFNLSNGLEFVWSP